MVPAGYAAGLVAAVAAMAWLRHSRWTWRAPRAAIASWQALGLAVGLSLIGLLLALGLAPYRNAGRSAGPAAGEPVPVGPALVRLAGDLLRGELPGALGPPHLAAVAGGLLVAGRLLWVTAACLVQTGRAQRHHRQLLALVGRPDPLVPGALVLDHPSAAAYCLPGLRPTVVVSAGTLGLLRGDELAAVLCHERSHATERHDLVLLPFTALHRAVPPARWLPPARWVRAAIRSAAEAVGLLVEMRADDRARRQYPDGLATALRRFADSRPVAAPAGALGVADRAVAVRVRRLRERRRPPFVRAAVTLLVALALAATPAGLSVLAG